MANKSREEAADELLDGLREALSEGDDSLGALEILVVVKGFEDETVRSTARLMNLDPETLESVVERLMEADHSNEFDGNSVDTIVSGVEELVGR